MRKFLRDCVDVRMRGACRSDEEDGRLGEKSGGCVDKKVNEISCVWVRSNLGEWRESERVNRRIRDWVLGRKRGKGRKRS